MIIDQAIWRSRIRQTHPPTNIKPQTGEESPFVNSPFVHFNKDYPSLFLYLILTFEKTNQTLYLKPNNLSTAIIDQAVRRSGIRQPHPNSNMKLLPGALGLLSFQERYDPDVGVDVDVVGVVVCVCFNINIKI